MNTNPFQWVELTRKVWPDFVKANPDLQLRPDYWACVNFLRLQKDRLLDERVITKGNSKKWFADVDNFAKAARAAALNLPIQK